jgi:hypothetical protein
MNGDQQDRCKAAGEGVAVSSEAEKLTRRQMLGATTAVGVTATFVAASASGATDPPVIADAAGASDPQLAREIYHSSVFELSGESMSAQRLQAMRGLLETNLKEVELLRTFDPDEEEPVTRFRPW